MLFTVFGIYPDTLQRHCEEVEGKNAEEAEAKYRRGTGFDDLMMVAAVVKGRVKIADTGKTHAQEGMQ